MADPVRSVQSPPNLPPPRSFHPTTFLERGIPVPFTTPMLAGTRVRPAERGGIELVVPNPSGGKGVYVLPWDGVHQLCRPTVHDTRLSEVLAGLQNVTPATIRQAARQVAGREPSTAAKASVADEHHARVLVNFLLLLELIEQVEPGGVGDTSAAPIRIVEVEPRVRRALVRVAPRLGLRAQEVADGLEQLAAIFSGVGLPGQSPPTRITRLLGALERLRTEIEAWGKECDGDSGAYGAMIAGAADLTLDCARRTLAEAHAAVRDIPALLQQWRLAPSRTRPGHRPDGMAARRLGADLHSLAQCRCRASPPHRPGRNGAARSGSAA